MRTLCLLLLLANALFLGWSQLIDVRVTDLQRRPAVSAPPPRIVLAREAGNAKAPAAESSQPLVEPAPASPKSEPQVPLAASPPPTRETPRAQIACTSVGPFAESTEAAAAEAALRTAGFKPRQRMVQGELWVGVWVSVQNFASRQAAEQSMKLLTDKGMTDVYVLPESEAGNILSLGVFSDRQRAQRRADEARALGLDPRIDDRKRAGSVYWVDVDQPEPVQPVDTSIFQTDPGKIMRLELRNCPAGTVD